MEKPAVTARLELPVNPPSELVLFTSTKYGEINKINPTDNLSK